MLHIILARMFLGFFFGIYGQMFMSHKVLFLAALLVQIRSFSFLSHLIGHTRVCTEIDIER